jgi:hypothetical protein
MLPLTIFLGKLMGALLHHRGAGDDGAQAKRRRSRQCANQEPAAPAARRSARPRYRSRHGARSQYLVGGRAAGRHHPVGVVDSDPSAVLLALPQETIKFFEALRYESVFTSTWRDSGPGSFPDLCGLQRVILVTGQLFLVRSTPIFDPCADV